MMTCRRLWLEYERLWNGTEQDLTVAADELVKEGILVPMDFSQEDKSMVGVPQHPMVSPPIQWRC